MASLASAVRASQREIRRSRHIHIPAVLRCLGVSAKQPDVTEVSSLWHACGVIVRVSVKLLRKTSVPCVGPSPFTLL